MASAGSMAVNPSGPHLLGMPAELRNLIFREVLVSASQVRITKDDHEAPGLLRVNRQIRQEARPIYYCENLFKIYCPDFEPAALLAFRQQSQDILPAMGISECRRLKLSVSCALGEPRSVRKLLRWAKAAHSDPQIPRAMGPRDGGRKAGYAIVYLAAKLADLPWDRVRHMLKKVARSYNIDWRS